MCILLVQIHMVEKKIAFVGGIQWEGFVLLMPMSWISERDTFWRSLNTGQRIIYNLNPKQLKRTLNLITNCYMYIQSYVVQLSWTQNFYPSILKQKKLLILKLKIESIQGNS